MAPPVNDNFASATGPLSTSLPGSVAGTTFDATKEATEPAFLSNDQSVWYYFVPASTGWYKFWIDPADITYHNGQSLSLSIGTPTTLAGYTTSAVDTRVDNPDSFAWSGFQTVADYLTSGTTYYIKVASSKPGSANAQSVDFTLRWDAFTPPAYNDFASAHAVGTLPASLTVDTFDATSEASEPVISVGFYTAMQSRWYTFTAAASGLHRVRLVNDDFVLTGNSNIGDSAGYVYAQVFKDFVDTLAETTEANALAVNILSGASSSDVVLSFTVPSAGTYYIRVSTPYIIKATGDGVPHCFNNATASVTMEVEAASAPANDNFASPTVLSTTLPATLPGQTTFDSTQEASEPDVFSSGSNIEQSVWYTFTPTSTDYYAFRIPFDDVVYNGTHGVSSGELNIGIWDESALTDITIGNRIAWSNMFPENEGQDALMLVPLTSGVTYYIKVASGFGTTYNRSTCDFALEWDVGAPPANDDFADAITITGSSGSIEGSNLLADLETGEGVNLYDDEIGFGGGRSVWYKWVATDTANFAFWTSPLGSAIGDSILTISQGSAPNTVTIIGQNDDGEFDDIGTYSEVHFDATLGQTYYITVDGYNGDPTADGGYSIDSTADGEFTLNWDYTTPPAPPPPVNDNIHDGIELPYAYKVCTTGTTLGATTEVGELNTFPGNINPPYPSVWYQYYPPNYSNQPLDITFDTVGSVADTYLEIFTPDSFTPDVDELTLVDSDHNSGAGGASEVVINSDGDVEYWIRVSSPDTDWGAFNLNITIDPGGSPPANDDFANAELLSGYTDSTTGTTVGATGECGEQLLDTFEHTNSVWYHYVPPQTGRLIIKALADTPDKFTNIYTYRGTVLNDLVFVDHTGFTTEGGDETYESYSVEGGVDYYFLVQGEGGFEDTFTLSVKMANVTPPANDTIAGATVITALSGNLDISNEGANWDDSGPLVGNFVTAAQTNITTWYKFTAERYGALTITFNSSESIDDLDEFDGNITIYRGTLPDNTNAIAGAITPVGRPFSSLHTATINVYPGETYWLLFHSFTWTLSTDIDYAIVLQDENTSGFTLDPQNGTSDFDSTTGTFVGDDEDNEFVASGGVGYGTITPWADEDQRYPWGWWCRFNLRSTSGDYLYRYGQSQQHIEIFRAEDTGGDTHSLCIIGHREGYQTLGFLENGSLVYDYGYRLWGADTQGTSESIRIEVGSNGLTVDGRHLCVSTFDNPLFPPSVGDKFHFGILTYPTDGTAYVDLDPEWNFRYSDIKIHDNPVINVMGAVDTTTPEITSLHGWTNGELLYDPDNTRTILSFNIFPSGYAPTVIESSGDYDGYSLFTDITSPSNVSPSGFKFYNQIGGITDGTPISPFTGAASDGFNHGFSFRFWVHTMPNETVCIGSMSNGSVFNSDMNGMFLYLSPDGTLSIKPSFNSSLIPFCTTEVDKWNYIELQGDTTNRRWTTKIWLDDVYMGNFQSTYNPTYSNADISRYGLAPFKFASYELGRFGDANLSSGSFNDALISIEFRDVSTTRRKPDRPLGPTIVKPMGLIGTGVHNCPEPEDITITATDLAQNGDFSGGVDGAGQPHYWTGWDRHDTATPSGAMKLQYLFQTFGESNVTLTTDGSGPPGLEGANAMQIEAITQDAGGSETFSEAAYVFGGATTPEVDISLDIDYADTISAQFWLKGVAGQGISMNATSGIGGWEALNTHYMSGDWEYVKLFLYPAFPGGIQVTSLVLSFPNSSPGDIFLVKDFHYYVNADNNTPNFYSSPDSGATVSRVPSDDEDTWELIDEFPPTIDTDQIYMNVDTLKYAAKSKEDDGKTHLPPMFADYYLEYKFDTYGQEEAIYGAKILLGIKGYNGRNLFTGLTDYEAIVSGFTRVSFGNSEGEFRYGGDYQSGWHVNDTENTLYGLQMSRPPGNSEWNITEWNQFRIRFGFFNNIFENSFVIINDYTNAGVVEGVAAEILTFDRRLSPPTCIRPVDLSRVRFRAWQENDIDD